MEGRSKFVILNLCWSIGCLTAIIIAITSAKFAKSPEMVNIISVALSLVSLIMAIIAIFQTLISSGALSNSIFEINSAASNILSSRKDLVEFSESINRKFDKIVDMPDKLEGVRYQLDELNSKSKLSPTPEIAPAEPPTPSDDFDTEAAYKRTTRGTVVALYAAMRAKNSGVKFECSEIFEAKLGGYYDGVIAGLKLSGIATITQDGTKFVIHDLGPFSDKDIEKWMLKALNAEDEKTKKFVQGRRDKIDSFFLEAAPSD